MNTFFISPLIPLKFYIIIQKEKYNPSLSWDREEINLIKNINKLFNYEQTLTEQYKKTVYNIIEKICDNIPEYSDLKNKLTFVNQNTFKEITNYNYVYYNLLLDRNYNQVINPYKFNNVNICIGLSDTGPLTELNVSKFNNINTDSEKFEYINKLIETKDNNTKNITHDIMSKSYVDTKINTITKILSNKTVLYNTLKDVDFIPISEYFDISDDDLLLQTIVNKFKENIQSTYFVIKPAEGTLSDGVGIFNINELNLNFVKTWIINPNNNKYSISERYSSWILSEFIQSFLWKLQGQNLTSQVFPQLTEKEPQLKFNFDDKIGRINKFRFWALYTIIDDEFTSYLYKNGYSELSLEELTNYSKTQLDPANIEEFYQELLNTEEDPDKLEEIIKNGPNDLESEKIEASFVGTYLDFARVVNESNYPLGENAWNNSVMPQMYSLVNTIANKTKRFMNCLNKYSLEGTKGCYSFFALDIIIDENSKPWLLETNSRPFIGFDDYFNKYDPKNNHVLNVKDVINGILGLTTDIVNGGGLSSVNYDDFLVTHIENINETSKLYTPLSLGIKNTSTSEVYNNIYNILDDNKYSSFPYPREMGKNLKKSIGFRGLSHINKFLVNKIAEIGNDKFLSLMKELYPYDSKMKLLNRISTLGFYLGNKVELTNILRNKVNKWYNIIPYSIIINIKTLKEKGTNIQEYIINQLNNDNFKTVSSDKIIAKPSLGQQGKGIIISEDISYLADEIIKSYDENNDESEWVISKYLDNPYLIKLNKDGVSGINYNDTYGRKSHLRVYVLLKKQNGYLQIYLYKKSLVFCAAKEYNSCENDEKSYCNLTNLYYGSKYYKDVLNKNPADAYKDLSILTDEIFNEYDYNHLMEQVKNIIKKTIIATKDNLICLNNPQHCYQYIAFDLHLENENGMPRPWLLEVNSTPGLKAPNYHFEKYGGINNFLESILNINIGTKFSDNNNQQLFEYLPYRLKIISDFDKIIFNNSSDCMKHTYKDLKLILKQLNIKNRSYLTKKNDMCNHLV